MDAAFGFYIVVATPMRRILLAMAVQKNVQRYEFITSAFGRNNGAGSTPPRIRCLNQVAVCRLLGMRENPIFYYGKRAYGSDVLYFTVFPKAPPFCANLAPLICNPRASRGCQMRAGASKMDLEASGTKVIGPKDQSLTWSFFGQVLTQTNDIPPSIYF